MRTRATIITHENAADYFQLSDELEAEWQPQTRTERCYLETMVTSRRLLARIAAIEQKIYLHIDFGEQQFKMLAYVAKLRAQLERSFRTAIADSRKKSARPGPSRSPRNPRQPSPRPRRPGT